MNPRVKLRLIGFEATILLVVVLIGWAGYVAFRSAYTAGLQTSKGVEDRRVAFKKTQAECFRLAGHIQAVVSELNQALFRFVARGDPAEWDRFVHTSREAENWIEEQKSSEVKMKQVIALEQFSFSFSTGNLIEEIDRVYHLYLTSASRIGDKSIDRDKRLKYFEEALDDSRQLLTLSGQVRGQGEVIQLLQMGKPEFPWHKLVLFAGLVALVMLGGWLIVIVYRREVMPVHTALMESKTIIERQQKLAHFGELAAGLAHEIKQPLTAVKARLFALRRSIPKETPEFEDAEVIETEINSLQQIVTEFLKLARPADPVLVPMTASALLGEVHRLLAAGLQRKSIALVLGTIVDKRFSADSQQLKQVLINLIQNAADSIGHDGTITVTARPGEHHLRDGVREVVFIEVTDTGPGIAPEIQKRLFDPFFSTKKGGAGLGLSISARLVAKHGGTLEFHNNPDRGATFAIVLPVCATHDEIQNPHH